jgi:tRNA threonylcarbamoyladenosine biosynthesis protein TsaE
MPVADLTEPELARWGERFGRDLALPAWITLAGELGAGKTTLVRAIARAQGLLEPVTSPTYSVVREYHSPRGRVFHLDLYRLERPDELHQLGWEEIGRHGALVLVEWPELAREALPKGCTALHLAHVEGRPEVRRLTW